MLDASALLALLLREVGLEAVGLDGAAMSAVNWSEVVQKLARRGADVDGLRDALRAQGLDVCDLTPRRAEAVAHLWHATQGAGLSLADRACLALAVEFGVPALSADQAWARLDVGAEVVIVR